MRWRWRRGRPVGWGENDYAEVGGIGRGMDVENGEEKNVSR